MERIIRFARTHEEAELCDREDLERLTFEERINAVEQLRKVWFGEDRALPRLDRALTSATPAARKISGYSAVTPSPVTVSHDRVALKWQGSIAAARATLGQPTVSGEQQTRVGAPRLNGGCDA